MGELHLEIIKNKLVRDMKVNVTVGKPRVAYRETITGTAKDVRGLFKKQSGGRGQYGDAVVTIMPITPEEAATEELEMENGIVFEDKVQGGAIPREFIPSVEYGIRQAAASGVIGGFPVINCRGSSGSWTSPAAVRDRPVFEGRRRRENAAERDRCGRVDLPPPNRLM
jgi:elongation factor G